MHWSLSSRVGDNLLRARRIAPGVTQVELSNGWSRMGGFRATCYLAGDLLIDTGFVHVRGLLIRFLADRVLRAVCLTHHHEDHAGASGVVARWHHCPVYLHRPGLRFEEGVRQMVLYRRFWWGVPLPYVPQEPPAVIEGNGHQLEMIATPGHSATHVAYLDGKTGIAFAGDLYITGKATAVMTHENPWESIRSLRRLAEREPALLANGHGLVLDHPARALREKAERVEEAAHHVLQLHRRGWPASRIERRVFDGGRARDRILAVITRGEFCRRNFVRAVIFHAGD